MRNCLLFVRYSDPRHFVVEVKVGVREMTAFFTILPISVGLGAGVVDVGGFGLWGCGSSSNITSPCTQNEGLSECKSTWVYYTKY